MYAGAGEAAGRRTAASARAPAGACMACARSALLLLGSLPRAAGGTACGVAEDLQRALLEQHPYPRGLGFAVQVTFGHLRAAWGRATAAAFAGLAERGWHLGQIAVQVPDEGHLGLLRDHVAAYMEDIPDIDVVSLELRWLNYSGVTASRNLLEPLLTEVLRLPAFNVRTLHVFCPSSAQCWQGYGAPVAEVGGFREFARSPRICNHDDADRGVDVLLASACSPFDCDIEVAGKAEGEQLPVRRHLVWAVEALKAGAVNMHKEGEAQQAGEDMANVVRLYNRMRLKEAMRPLPPSDNEQGSGLAAGAALPATGRLCECWSGLLALRLFPVLMGYPSDMVKSWIEAFRASPAAPTDFVYALARTVAEVETVTRPGDDAEQALRAEEQRIFGGGRFAPPFWLTQRRSLSYGLLARSGWPIFRTLASIQLRLRVLDLKHATGWRASRAVCNRPLTEEVRWHLWIALEDEQPYSLDLMHEFYQTSFMRPTDLGCVLAVTSCLVAQAAALQCRAAVAWKPRSMAALALDSAQEILESYMAADAPGLLRGLFSQDWPLLWMLARMERDYDILRPHARPLPAGFRTHWVEAGSTLWSGLPQPPKLVSFGSGEKVLRGGHWARRFSQHVFGEHEPFVIREDFPCPDVIVFMGVRPFPNNGIGIYVQAESGHGYVPPDAPGLIYLGPKEDVAGAENRYGAVFDVPFASSSFAFRMRGSPRELQAPRASAPAGGLRGAVAYLAARCVPHREAHFRALRDELGGEAVALGVCNGSSLENATATAQTPGRMAEDFMDASVDLLRGFEFVLAFENANVSGYVTEKIVSAYLAGAIPIYWGTPYVMSIFRRESFIYAPAFSTPADLARYVASLRGTPRAQRMRSAPALQPGALGRFFSWHKDVPGPLGNEIRATALRLLGTISDPDM